MPAGYLELAMALESQPTDDHRLSSCFPTHNGIYIHRGNQLNFDDFRFTREGLSVISLCTSSDLDRDSFLKDLAVEDAFRKERFKRRRIEESAAKRTYRDNPYKLAPASATTSASPSRVASAVASPLPSAPASPAPEPTTSSTTATSSLTPAASTSGMTSGHDDLLEPPRDYTDFLMEGIDDSATRPVEGGTGEEATTSKSTGKRANKNKK